MSVALDPKKFVSKEMSDCLIVAYPLPEYTNEVTNSYKILDRKVAIIHSHPNCKSLVNDDKMIGFERIGAILDQVNTCLTRLKLELDKTGVPQEKKLIETQIEIDEDLRTFLQSLLESLIATSLNKELT